MQVIRAALLLAVFTTSAGGLQQLGGQRRQQGVQDAVRAWADAGEFQGVALLADQGEVVGEVATGWAQREWQVELTTDAVFPIASLTKQFTALLVMQSVQAADFELSSTLGELLPGWQDAAGKTVTVQSLLTHSAGFRDPPLEHYLDPRHVVWTDLQIAEEYLDQTPDFAPGTQFRYSNADYHLLGAVLEVATGQSFADLMRTRIAEPLQLAQTRLANRADVVPRRPADYVQSPSAAGWRRPTPFQWSNWQAAGGLQSSLADLHRWNQALVNFELLDQKHTEIMWTVPEQPGAYVALGSWSYSRTIPGSEVQLQLLERRGAIGGFAVLNAIDPQRKQWVILLSNHGDRTLDTLSYAECLPLDLFRVANDLEPLGPASAD